MQLLSIDDFVKNINDTRILIDMGEFKTKCEQKERLPVKTNNAYLAKLEKDLGGMHRYYRGVKIPFWDEIRIFPRMLIFHSLIVLIIAFVGNLIISDKSVTEPL